MKLFESELKVMEVLWERGDQRAKEIAEALGASVGWNVNTTYTVIKKCVAKGAVERKEPHFVCHALVSKEEIQAEEAEALLGRLFDGAPDLLFASLLSRGRLTGEQIERLRAMVEETEAP